MDLQKQVTTVIGISILFGVVFNTLRDNGIPWISKPIAQVVDTKEPKSDLIVHEVNELSINSVTQKIRSVSGAIRKRVFLPAPEGSWYCSKKWCFYWKICPYGESSK